MADDKIITIYTTKGGTGKTTTALHLADYFATNGKSVAMIDADERAMLRDQLLEAPETFPFPCYMLDNDGEAELGGDQSQDKMRQMAELIQEAKEGHDILIIDCGGYNSAASLFASSVADLTIVPVKPGRFDLQQTVDITAKVRRVARSLEMTPAIRALPMQVNLSTNVFAGLKMALEAEEIEAFATSIPLYTGISEASFLNTTIFRHRPASQAATYFERLAGEVEAILYGESA